MSSMRNTHVSSMRPPESDIKVLIIIPAYNEEDCIVNTVQELQATAPQYDYIIVNDGSTDATQSLCLQHHYNILDLPVNVGLTCGFQAGVKYALRNGYDAAMQFDADGQHQPIYISSMVEKMKKSRADIVIGSRFVDEKKSHSVRMLGSRIISGILFLTTGVHIADPTSGMRLYSQKALRVFASKTDFGPEPDSISWLINHGLRCVETQVEMRERMAGESYLNISRSIEYMVRTCTSILFAQWFR